VGGAYFDQLHPLRTRNCLVRRLQRLGLEVILKPRSDLPQLLPPPPSPGRKQRPPLQMRRTPNPLYPRCLNIRIFRRTSRDQWHNSRDFHSRSPVNHVSDKMLRYFMQRSGAMAKTLVLVAVHLQIGYWSRWMRNSLSMAPTWWC
jgi:hypothetical protein